MSKKRLLWVGEASSLSTGFSTYSLEILSRLHKTGRYDIAELACSAGQEDTRLNDVPWEVYTNNPRNEKEEGQFLADPENKHGKWKFGEVCLDFRPDIVADCRDAWCYEFQGLHTYRPFYRRIVMTTVDGYPQDSRWLADLKDCDAVLTYTDWGASILAKQGIYAKRVTPPAFDPIYRPTTDKAGHKINAGLPADSFIVGTVMRNQRRKLYPDLISTFARALDKLPKNSFLYLHTTYPDAGWDLPKLILEYGISSRVLFTYHCSVCGTAFPATYKDALTSCINCNQMSAKLPTWHNGVSRETLAKVYNLFDVYVQLSVCLAEKTPIYSKNGWKNIENIQVDDEVLTHKGNWKKVLKTFQNPNDECLEIKCHALPYKLTVTKEHPFYAITKNNSRIYDNERSLRENIGTGIRLGHGVPEPQFVEAGDLKIGDMLAFKIDDRIQEVKFIDLANYLPVYENPKYKNIILEDKICCFQGKPRDRFLEITPEFCKFIGIFAAEGSSTSKGLIRVTTHTRESNLRNDCLQIFPNMKERKYKNRNGVDLSLYSEIHRLWAEHEFSKKENKKLPDWTLFLPTELQQFIIEGLFAGDGCYVKNKKVTAYVTISKKMAEQVQHILRRLRINFNLRISKKGGNRKSQWRFEVPGNIASREFISKRNSSMGFYYGDWHFIQIKSITPSEYDGYVYNIEVEDDNSYMTNLGIVHNCEGAGMPQLEAGACGVPVLATNYSAMETVCPAVGGELIPVARFFREQDTNRYMALPDNNKLMEKLIEYSLKPESLRKIASQKIANMTRKNFSYDESANKWDTILQQMEPALPWNLPSRASSPMMNFPANLSDSEFVQWCIKYVGGCEQYASGYFGSRLVRDLNWGMSYVEKAGPFYREEAMLYCGFAPTKFNREMLVNVFLQYRKHFNEDENRRVNSVQGALYANS